MTKLLLMLLVLVVLCGGCAIAKAKSDAEGAKRGAEATAEEAGKEAKKERRPFLVGVLLYLPNRVLDLCDVARFGVDVGPGVGVDVRVTKWAQAVAMMKASVGVGYQTFRHLPISAGGVTGVGIGPVALEAGEHTWYRADWDVRAEAHVLLVGAHAAVDLKEIADFFVGFLTIDLMDDDL